MRYVLLAAATLAASTASADLKSEVAKFEKAKAAKVAAAASEVKKAKADLAVWQAGIVRKVRTVFPPDERRKQAIFPSLAIKNAYVAKASAEVAKAEKAHAAAQGETFGMTSTPAVPKVGNVFSFSDRINVVQVIDEDAMLVRDFVSEGGGVTAVGDRVFREAVVTRELLFMMRGVSTEGITDDSGYEPKGLFEVTGTESYTTVSGAKKTVFVLRPFDIERLKK